MNGINVGAPPSAAEKTFGSHFDGLSQKLVMVMGAVLLSGFIMSPSAHASPNAALDAYNAHQAMEAQRKAEGQAAQAEFKQSLQEQFDKVAASAKSVAHSVQDSVSDKKPSVEVESKGVAKLSAVKHASKESKGGYGKEVKNSKKVAAPASPEAKKDAVASLSEAGSTIGNTVGGWFNTVGDALQSSAKVTQGPKVPGKK